MITRKKYIAGDATHEEYYSQFVDCALLRTVSNVIGTTRIVESTDPHFNDIALADWDEAGASIPLHTLQKLRKAEPGAGVSLSDRVCIVKAAAASIALRDYPLSGRETRLRDLFLDWFNNYLTVEKFAEHTGLSVADARERIEKGRIIHENNVERINGGLNNENY
jgi:hypothetical protein